MLNELVKKPLLSLDRHQDKNVIEYVEIVDDKDENPR